MQSTRTPIERDRATVRTGRRWVEHIKKSLEATAFWRGCTGTLAFITLLAQFVNLENYEVARAINAILIGWSIVASYIGDLIGKIPFVPALDATAVNLALFMTSVTIPALFGGAALYGEAWGKEKIDLGRERFFPAIMLAALSVLFLFGPYLFFYGAFDQIAENAARYHAESVWPSPEIRGNLEVAPIVMLTMGMPFIFALTLRPYRLGTCFLLGAIFIVELSYYAPFLQDYIRDFSAVVFEAVD